MTRLMPIAELNYVKSTGFDRLYFCVGVKYTFTIR